MGRDAIVADWLTRPGRTSGTYEGKYSPYAVDGDRAVAIGESRYTKPDGSFRTLYYNLWTLRSTTTADASTSSSTSWSSRRPAGPPGARSARRHRPLTRVDML